VRRDRERISEPRVVIFIDELADLMEQGGKAMNRLMTRLTQRGRSAGLHIVACTQKPLVASIGSITRSNFPVRLVGSVTSADDAKIAAGIAGTGAEKLLGRGDCRPHERQSASRAAVVGRRDFAFSRDRHRWSGWRKNRSQTAAGADVRSAATADKIERLKGVQVR
jgi:DNA segregation ATPase FtsK/SpoIIIE-like protein